MATKKPTAATKKKVKPTQKSKATTNSATVKTVAPKAVVKDTKKVDELKKTSKADDIVAKNTDNKSIFKGFFAKKYEGDEGILNIFKKPKLYGALISEVLGTMLITMLLLSLSLIGIANIATYAFSIIAVYVAFYALSGSHLNPIVTVGMMATRRVSVIRGVLYIIAQVIGAWLAWIIFNAFYLVGGETALAQIPEMAPVADGAFWTVTIIELVGSLIIAFFFARALSYKRSVFTFAAIVAGGMVFAVLIGYIVSAAFVSLSNNFIFNPAAALMYQIFPTAGETFGEILGGVCLSLVTYVIFPMIGGVVGFYLSDFAGKLANE